VIPLDRLRIEPQPLYGIFLIVKFKLEFLIGVQSSDPLNTKIPPISYFFGRRVVFEQTASELKVRIHIKTKTGSGSDRGSATLPKTLFKNSKSKFKNVKHTPVNVLSYLQQWR
jgi:hypothetical protein